MPTAAQTTAIPQELKRRPQWVCYRIEERDGKLTKVPYAVRGGRASANNPQTWAMFREAVKHAESAGMTGIGFVFSEDDPYTGLDLDDCRDLETGELEEWAREVVEELGSYAELSPSGTGVHVFVKAVLPAGGNRKGPLEMYDSGRFFTATGARLPDAPEQINARQDALDALHRRVFPPEQVEQAESGKPAAAACDLADSEILHKLFSGRDGEKVSRLYFSGDTSDYGGDDSRADLALCSYLARVVGPDEGRIDDLFRRSALNREKWEKRPDYRDRTIGKALSGLQHRSASASSQRTPAAAEPPPRANGHGGGPPNSAGTADFEAEGFNLTDLGNAERFAAANAADVRWCEGWKRWLANDGRRWAPDKTRAVPGRAQTTVRMIYGEAQREEDAETRRKVAEHARKSEGDARIKAMLEQAKPKLPAQPEQFDTDPWLFNVNNGTVYLKTGELAEHRREDYITKLAPVDYDPQARAPEFERFLERIIPSAEIREYLKRLVGYSLTGKSSEHILPILYGTGANGKSTLLNALLEAFGDYGMQAAPDLLVSKQDSHPTELADLFGARFVGSVEVEDGRRLSEGLVKQLTGGDRIKARRMREDFWEFDPTFLFFMAVNHKPQVRGTDNGIWRRLRCIPFTETIPPEEQDRDLAEKLRAELPGILAWAVEGCLEWQRDGLQTPREVLAATEEYREEQDMLAAFIAERCVRHENASATATELYKDYREWCEDAGERPVNKNRLSQQLTERGYERHKNGCVRYYGIGLRYEGGDDPGSGPGIGDPGGGPDENGSGGNVSRDDAPGSGAPEGGVEPGELVPEIPSEDDPAGEPPVHAGGDASEGRGERKSVSAEEYRATEEAGAPEGIAAVMVETLKESGSPAETLTRHRAGAASLEELARACLEHTGNDPEQWEQYRSFVEAARDYLSAEVRQALVKEPYLSRMAEQYRAGEIGLEAVSRSAAGKVYGDAGRWRTVLPDVRAAVEEGASG